MTLSSPFKQAEIMVRTLSIGTVVSSASTSMVSLIGKRYKEWQNFSHEQDFSQASKHTTEKRTYANYFTSYRFTYLARNSSCMVQQEQVAAASIGLISCYRRLAFPVASSFCAAVDILNHAALIWCSSAYAPHVRKEIS